ERVVVLVEERRLVRFGELLVHLPAEPVVAGGHPVVDVGGEQVEPVAVLPLGQQCRLVVGNCSISCCISTSTRGTVGWFPVMASKSRVIASPPGRPCASPWPPRSPTSSRRSSCRSSTGTCPGPRSRRGRCWSCRGRWGRRSAR